MSFYVPKRSTGGCLTCKQRKKKCDETKPFCQRCIGGDFSCLGYNLLGAIEDSNPITGEEDSHTITPVHMVAPNLDEDHHTTTRTPGDLPSVPEHVGVVQGARRAAIALRKSSSFIEIPRGPQLQSDSFMIDQVLPLILSQYTRFSRHIVFKPPSIPIEDGFRWRVSYSQITRLSMYLGARILEDISNGNSGERYLSWVTRLYQQITESLASAKLDSGELHMCLAGISDLTTYVFTVSGTSMGYPMFRSSASLFLRLAALSPELWSNDAAISISEALRTRPYGIKNFVFHDTVTALALGIPPLIHYDTTSSWAEEKPNPYLQWVYGFPVGLIVLLAKINSWRTSRLMAQTLPGSNRNDWREIEERLQSWTPTVDHTDEASDDIARLAIQEALRQAALIYLYMGMCEVNSADPRVESGVRQIIQLAGTIGSSSPLRLNLFIPCLIAGAAARQEKHRAIIRRKLEVFRNVLSLILRGADFIVVLDHLWHGAASGGCPTTWEDYVQSRCATLPISP